MPWQGNAGARAPKLLLRALLALLLVSAATVRPAGVRAEAFPIQHVVIVYMENHSFDNVLGKLCVVDDRCDGALSGKAIDGTVVPITRAQDRVELMAHNYSTQQLVINHGKMNGWSLLGNCKPEADYACYSQYWPEDIPSLARLARTFTISDRTFQMDIIPTWGAHLELVAGQLAGFRGDNPRQAPGQPQGPGWGCDSFKEALWHAAPADPFIMVPSCVPDEQGRGPFRPSPVSHVPTIMSRVSDAGLDWKIYAPSATAEGGMAGYGRSICPTFAECLLDPDQFRNFVDPDRFVEDARAGTLPNLSIVIPTGDNSQHNGNSMMVGDNWIADIANAAMNGPDWGSTAIFITYDDCGCFYDHVRPPPTLGIRTPMVIVSPWVKPGFTDSNIASYASMLSFTERVFGLEPLSVEDRDAYDYFGAFDFAQEPIAPLTLEHHPVSPKVLAEIAADPPDPNEDPT